MKNRKETRTLFLDRDGVINRRVPGAYIQRYEDFHFIPGSIEAMVNLRKIFDRIIIVTNQKGVGKGLMSMQDLADIHFQMERSLLDFGIAIDAIYAATTPKWTKTSRHKPNPIMGLEAKKAFPDIDFSNATIVGDSASDMEFGINLGMTTILVEGKFEDTAALRKLPIDYQFKNLLEFAKWQCGY